MSEAFENRDQLDSTQPEFPWKFFLPALIIAGCTSIIGVIVAIIGKYCWDGKPLPLQKGKATPKVDTIGTESLGSMKDVEANPNPDDSAQLGSSVNDVACSDTIVEENDCNTIVNNEGKGGSENEGGGDNK